MLRLFEIAHRVEQVKRVLGPNVEWIAFESRFNCGTPGLHLAQPQQRHAEIQVCIPQARRDLSCATGKLSGLLGASRDRRVMRECVVNLSVSRADGECGCDFRFKVTILKVEHRRA